MNNAQKKVIAAALVLIVLMALFPPWQVTSGRMIVDIGYWPVWKGGGGPTGPSHVNAVLLLVQWLGVVLVAVGCCCLATRPPPREEGRAP